MSITRFALFLFINYVLSSVVSNHYIPGEEMIVPVMTKDFDEHVKPSLKGLADKYLPRKSIFLIYKADKLPSYCGIRCWDQATKFRYCGR